MAEMREKIARLTAAASTSAADIDRLRAILIACGEWEQAAGDDVEMGDDVRAILRDLTDCAADAFSLCWRLQSSLGPRPGANLATFELKDPILDQIAPWIDGVTAQLAAVPASDVALKVEVPAGFDRFALYPEQYAAAAELWCRHHVGLTAASRAAIVGIEANGTTLSAVVAAVLRLNGWRVSRNVAVAGGQFDGSTINASTYVLIVDGNIQGGALSMSAVAESFESIGIDRRRVSYFPAGEDTVDPTMSYWVRRNELKAAGRSFAERLALRTVAHFGAGEGIKDVAIEELDGDRPAYRIELADGRSLVWRFAGLVDGVADVSTESAPVDAVLGFVAVPA